MSRDDREERDGLGSLSEVSALCCEGSLRGSRTTVAIFAVVA